MDIEYKLATDADMDAIVAFVDYWLTGGGEKDGIPGATHDFFVRFGRHKDYLKKYDVMLATVVGEIVGWAVKTNKGVLIHMLIAATYRHQGIGAEMIRRLRPPIVRSKSDQKSGDPAGFYRKQGYIKVSPEKVGRKKNIDIFEKAAYCDGTNEQSPKAAAATVKVASKGNKDVFVRRRRTIDVIAGKFADVDFHRTVDSN